MTDQQRNILNLIQRSKPGPDGWYRVSKPIWPFVAVITDDLIEKRPEAEGGYVRLTDRGQAVSDYM